MNCFGIQVSNSKKVTTNRSPPGITFLPESSQDLIDLSGIHSTVRRIPGVFAPVSELGEKTTCYVGRFSDRCRFNALLGDQGDLVQLLF